MMSLFLIIASGFFAQASAQMCRTTGNVEVTKSNTTGNALTLMFSFKNYNNYMVNVNVSFTIIDNDGNESNLSDIIVIPANETKTYKISSTMLPVNKPIDCRYSGCSISVTKCD